MRQRQQGPARVATGILGLDVVLNGGFLRGGMYLLLGGPGTGKTVLANQLCFNRAASGERAVCVSLLAESHDRLLEHLRSFEFFNPQVVGRELLYLGSFTTLESEGPDGLRDVLQRTVRKHRANVLVIDSLATVSELSKSPLALKKFLRQLATFCAISKCTCLLLTSAEEAIPQAEASIVDGIVKLSRVVRGVREGRELEVIKFRGSAHLNGRHAFFIDERGTTVHPRTEALLGNSLSFPRPERERVSLGVPRLDEMLRGGVFSGSTTLLMGGPGTGKTTLGLHFLAAGAEQGECGIYFGFNESPPRLIAKAEGIGLAFGEYVGSGRVELVWQPAVEHSVDALAERLLGSVYRAQARRVFIDGVGGFRQGAALPERMPLFFTSLSIRLREYGVTTLVSEETSFYETDLDLSDLSLSASCENILHLRYTELNQQLRRLLAILKQRESDFDPSLREFHITPKGMGVGGSVARERTGRPRQAPRAPTQKGKRRRTSPRKRSKP